MPTESVPAESPAAGSPFALSSQNGLKCSLCGVGALSAAAAYSTRGSGDLLGLSDPIERICGGCVRAQEPRGRQNQVSSLGSQKDDEECGLGIRGLTVDDMIGRSRHTSMDREHEQESVLSMDIPQQSQSPTPLEIPSHPSSVTPLYHHSQSLPAQHPKPWTTATAPSGASPVTVTTRRPPSPNPRDNFDLAPDVMPNPLLDVTKARIPSIGRGALYPGSVFRGTQTSGRSAYEVEVKFLDVNFPESTVSGYLSISHLTDAHPQLTTFFTGDIIGSKYGFITGSRFGATEHDDMRHWGRFEQFRRPATRADMVRPELFFRDPLPDRSRGETKGKERDFVFLRIKEKFLVPDHKVRDISGASFAGFYFAMVDLAPTALSISDMPTTPTSPTAMKAPLSPTSPTVSRRMSSSDGRSPSRPPARRRQSSSRFIDLPPVRSEATIRGYYFHSLNQEPFQELFLTHVPARSSSTFELR